MHPPHTPHEPPRENRASPDERPLLDIAVIGAGAAGLFAAIWAGRTAQQAGSPLRIVAVDGARTLGAKILVAGGGRCNVTHHAVDESAFAGSTRPAIRRVLRRFAVERTVEFFAELGVTLKREETGKLFPTTDSARTILDALLRAADDAGVEILHPWRVESIARREEPPPAPLQSSFPAACQTASSTPTLIIRSIDGRAIAARRVILATGGRSLPKSGSDGAGLAMAQSLGHALTGEIHPSLVPLLLPDGHVLRSLAGIASEAVVEVRSGSGRRLVAFTGNVLCTHFGLSGPAILDVSRWLIAARHDDPGATFSINWIPGTSAEQLEVAIRDGTATHPWSTTPRTPPRTAAQLLRAVLPERLADALVGEAGIDPHRSLRQLSRDERRRLVTVACAMEIPIVGDRGWTYAEVTAGGVPLAEVDLGTLESRVVPGLHLCGEILDVDGRIGGFNFQWAWASGHVAGSAAAGASFRIVSTTATTTTPAEDRRVRPIDQVAGNDQGRLNRSVPSRARPG